MSTYIPYDIQGLILWFGYYGFVLVIMDSGLGVTKLPLTTLNNTRGVLSTLCLNSLGQARPSSGEALPALEPPGYVPETIYDIS